MNSRQDKVRLPGLANLWVPPIRNRIDMFPPGSKSLIGIKASDLALSERYDATAQSIEAVAKPCSVWCLSWLSDFEGGRYIDIDINREKASPAADDCGRRPAVRLFSNRWGYGGVRRLKAWPGTLLTFASGDYRNSPRVPREMPILTSNEAANYAGRCCRY